MFLMERMEDYDLHPLAVTEEMMFAVKDSTAILMQQSGSWNEEFQKADESFRENAGLLFKRKLPTIKNSHNIPEDYLGKFYEEVGDAFKKDRFGREFDDNLGCGPFLPFTALIILATLSAAMEAADGCNVDRHAVLEAVAEFLADMDFKPFAQHAGKLVLAIKTDLPSILGERILD